jgi:tRNA (cytosine40_48-C5)-methyltransferase
MAKTYLPDSFKRKYIELLGKEEAEEFFKSCNTRLTKSIRINGLKIDSSDVLKIFKQENILIKEIDWLKGCYFIESEVSALGNLIEQLTGLCQMQEVSSVLPAVVLAPSEKDIVLDLCSAPGNKTACIAEIMNNKGLIVANDADIKRIKTLVYTLKKLGVANTIVACENGIDFQMKDIKFNKVLIDAPCSGEGLVRKKADALKDWSENLVKAKSSLQKKLITSGFVSLKSGGELVYSTCTLSPEENEEVVDYLLNNNKDASILDIPLKQKIPGADDGLTSYKGQQFHEHLKKAIRIWPHKTGLEGFFICKIRKD